MLSESWISDLKDQLDGLRPHQDGLEEVRVHLDAKSADDASEIGESLGDRFISRYVNDEGRLIVYSYVECTDGVSVFTYGSTKLPEDQLPDDVRSRMRIAGNDDMTDEQKSILNLLETVMSCGVDSKTAQKILTRLSERYDLVPKRD